MGQNKNKSLRLVKYNLYSKQIHPKKHEILRKESKKIIVQFFDRDAVHGMEGRLSPQESAKKLLTVQKKSL